MTDTVYALATAPGRAAVAVVRISGPLTRSAVEALGGRLPKAREARLRTLRNDAGEAIDRALVLWLPGPGSFTGEDSAELHLHGGQAIVDTATNALSELGLRPAEPGEFTRRAFENGKLDLAQAEAVADLIEAETEAQRRQALAQLGGALGRRHEAWRGAIVEALAVLDAGVDFPDEELPEDLAARARPVLAGLLAELDAALAEGDRGDRVREGYRIAIVGAPNAGKSSFLNRLARRDAAIVTAEPGTTRDVIEIPLVIDGYKVLIADTAGVRGGAVGIEAEGVRRARAWAETADLRLWVVDAAASDGDWREAVELVRADDLLLLNKSDLPAGDDAASAAELGHAPLLISSAEGSGLDELWAGLGERLAKDLAGADFPAATRQRHRTMIEEARARVVEALAQPDHPELAAESVRLAGRALARVTGAVDAESVLDRIFASFCIGK